LDRRRTLLTVQDIITKLRQNGYKITPQRQEIIGVLMLEQKHLTVEEIHTRISHRYPNLKLLDDMADTLKATSNGAALAAPQVGILRRIVVIDRQRRRNH